jgi:hypothetical protein
VKSSEAPVVNSQQKDAEINEIMQFIDSSPDWKISVEKKAAAKGISYREMLKLDATWVWEQKHK